MLWLAAYLPDLSLDLLGRVSAPGSSLAVVEGRGGRRRLVAVNEGARSLGVRPGLSLPAAWALAPHLRVLERDRGAEEEAICNISSWAVQFTSFVSLMPARGLLLEVGGSLDLFGGIDALRGAVAAGLAGMGYRSVLAVAPTPGGAWLLARAGRPEVLVDEGRLRERLALLPLTCTELAAETLETLAGLGVLSLGDLLRLPRDGLGRRLGNEVLGLLDRALGTVPDPRESWVPPRTFSARLRLPGEAADAEELLFPLNRLILDLAGYLRAVAGAVERVTVVLEHARGPATCLDIGLAGPSRSAPHLQLLLRERVRQVLLPSPVEGLALKADRVVQLAGSSLDLFDAPERSEEGWQQLVDRLRVRLGPEAVHGLSALPDHRPERAWCPRAGEGGTVGPRPGRRPLWLLDAPRALETSEGRPRWGGALELREGPERIDGGWWDGEDVARDYYVAESEAGERLWVYRDRSPPHGWFLHGLFG